MENSHQNMAGHNQKVYASKGVVAGYLLEEELFPAEKILFERLEPQLKNMRMLDIGIGGGRTTAHFAKRVKEYIGIDYAPGMIQSCEKRFNSLPASVKFSVGDARDLGQFSGQEFDLVLFSYNGLDYIPHEERLRALAEMVRVTKLGGTLIFSSHNLLGFGHTPRPQGESWIRRTLIQGLIRLVNGKPTVLKSKPFAVIRDDGLGFRLKTYYVQPMEQVRQLAQVGQDQVELLGIDGHVRPKSQSPDEVRDEWIYYVVTSVKERFLA